MRLATPAPRRPCTGFQYSIRDAGEQPQAGEGQGCGPFNTLLEMPDVGMALHGVFDVSNFQYSIRDASPGS